MIKGTIDSYELWQSRPENLNENMEDPIESAENRGWNQCNRSWIKTIEEQPRIGEWTPCSEMLPEDTKTKIITLSDGSVEGGYYSEENWWCVGDSINLEVVKTENVIAWMLLPPAYKEDKE